MVNIEPLSYFTAKGEFAERELLTPPNTQFLYDACIDKNGTAYYRASIVNTPGPALNP